MAMGLGSRVGRQMAKGLGSRVGRQGLGIKGWVWGWNMKWFWVSCRGLEQNSGTLMIDQRVWHISPRSLIKQGN